MNTHFFDVNVAIKHGVPVAIVLNHIAFWIQKNQANEKHFHDGRYWTYNSIKAFQVLFPYWSFKQMRAVLEKLKETGLILTGNYNHVNYDQTTWYALSDEGLKLFNILPAVDNISPICPKGQIDVPKTASSFAQKGKPIPDNKPDIKTHIKEKAFINKGGKTVDNSPRTGFQEAVKGNRKSNEMSEEAKNAKRGDVKTADYYLNNIKGIKLKRHRTQAG